MLRTEACLFPCAPGATRWSLHCCETPPLPVWTCGGGLGAEEGPWGSVWALGGALLALCTDEHKEALGGWGGPGGGGATVRAQSRFLDVSTELHKLLGFGLVLSATPVPLFPFGLLPADLSTPGLPLGAWPPQLSFLGASESGADVPPPEFLRPSCGLQQHEHPVAAQHFRCSES